MKKDVRIIVQNIQRYDDYTDKIVTNAIGNYSRSGSSHSVLYRESTRKKLIYIVQGQFLLKCLS